MGKLVTSIKIIINVDDIASMTSESLLPLVEPELKKILDLSAKSNIGVYGHFLFGNNTFNAANTTYTETEVEFSKGIASQLDALKNLIKDLKPAEGKIPAEIAFVSSTINRLVARTNVVKSNVSYPSLLSNLAELLEQKYPSVSVIVINPVKMHNITKLPSDILSTKLVSNIAYVKTSETLINDLLQSQLETKSIKKDKGSILAVLDETKDDKSLTKEEKALRDKAKDAINKPKAS